MYKFSDDSKAKLGNAVVYIAEHTKQLSKTKLLKLLYLMEERMVKKYNTPFLALPFEVWQAGPVVKDIFVDLSDGPFILKDYITLEQKDGGTYVSAKKDFSDDEFSQCEIEMMDEILAEYGRKTAKQLVELIHKKDGLWYEVAKENNLLEAFDRHECNNSNITIDFSKMLPEDAAERYKESLDIHQTANILKIDQNV